MFLTKSRIPILATVFILLLGFVLILGIASGDDADGPIPTGQFGDDIVGTEVGWDWDSIGQDVKIDIFLDDALAGQVFSIEVFIEPDTSTAAILANRHKPDYVRRMGDPNATFPTGRPISFTFTTTEQLTEASHVGIHLMGRDAEGNEIRIRKSDGPKNTNLLSPPPTPTPPPVPTPTPVPTTEVPTAQVTEVAAPTGGGAVVIQPSQAASVTSEDGRIAVAVPVTANATTFQIVLNPSPVSVPEAPAGTTILRAFELNAHDTAGAQVSLRLLKPVTITVKYTAEDVAAAPQQSPTNLRIVSYDATTQAWTPLHTTLDLATQTLTAKVSHLSLFGVAGIEPVPQAAGTPTPTPMPTPTATPTSAPTATPTPAPTATPTPALPPTGDFAPGSGLVLASIIAGFLLIMAGGAYLTQARRPRS